MSAPKGTEWKPEELDRLQTMWDDDGLSASEIGKVLGRSRSAVIGKVRRMEFARRASAVGGKKPSEDARFERLTSAQAKQVIRQFQVEDGRSFTQRFFGDPLPGRSALDQKKRTNARTLGQAGAQKRLSLHDESRGALWETACQETEAVH